MATEQLVTLPQAAELLNISYATLIGRYRKHVFGLPEPVADKAKRGASLYRAADFVECKKAGNKHQGLNNELAQLFITYQIGCKPRGVASC